MEVKNDESDRHMNRTRETVRRREEVGREKLIINRFCGWETHNPEAAERDKDGKVVPKAR